MQLTVTAIAAMGIITGKSVMSTKQCKLAAIETMHKFLYLATDLARIFASKVQSFPKRCQCSIYSLLS